MSAIIPHNDRFRPRAQSLFENRQRTNTELTVSLLDRFTSKRKLTDSSIDTNGSPDGRELVIRLGSKPTIFFISQPIVAGLVVFPLLIFVWQAGWNFMAAWLATPFGQHWAVLVALYILAQLIFLFMYLNQDRLYDYLRKRRSKLFIAVVLQLHTFMTCLTYVMQWVSMWTLWDRYTSEDWLLMLIVSIAAILAVTTIMGHPCDLVCAPFILSYDSVEYNIRIGTPFLTEKISERSAHLLNYIFYEFILFILSILAWRGSYALLDAFLFPKSESMSATVSLCLGYPLYFILMYTQSYSEKICSMPNFVYLNYPSLLKNIRHLIAFVSCVLLWRGYWMLFDICVKKIPFEQQYPYLFYTVCMLGFFLILSLMKTASSVHGPMSHMSDYYNLFPDYPNCYLILLCNDMKCLQVPPSDSPRTTTTPESQSNSFL